MMSGSGRTLSTDNLSFQFKNGNIIVAIILHFKLFTTFSNWKYREIYNLLQIKLNLCLFCWQNFVQTNVEVWKNKCIRYPKLPNNWPPRANKEKFPPTKMTLFFTSLIIDPSPGKNKKMFFHEGSMGNY